MKRPASIVTSERMTAARKLVIGIDEAGYGPNLGPLCFGASIWSVAEGDDVAGMAERLVPFFQPKPLHRKGAWIPLGDSKVLYQSTSDAVSLSVGLLAMDWIRQPYPPQSNSSLSHCLERWLEPTDLARLALIPWYSDRWDTAEEDSNGLPLAGRKDLAPILSDFLAADTLEQAKTHLTESSIQLLAIGARAIDEQEFNDQVASKGNKSHLLSSVSLEWIRAWLERYSGELAAEGTFERIEIYCDKHGGRNRYQGPLSQVFPETWFTAELESTACSRYVAEWHGIPMTWRFTAKGDAIVPSSLASMVAKWTRELFMHRFNTYWQNQIPNLKPTAGYPVDALRFASEIAILTQQLGFEKSQWWRQV